MSWTSGVVRRLLPNGLTLLAQREPSARVIAVVTHVKAGYFDEPDEWVGIAHVLEHMFFKGTARRGPREIARETQLLGGYLNASTIYDKTVYYTVLPAADGGLERALDIQSDALMHTALDAGELERELEVIIQEAKRKLDTPRAVVGETLYELLFRVHRMRRWRIGTEAGLRRLRADDVRAYHATRYRPDRVIVTLVGDLDVGRALELAAATYGSWSRPMVPIPPSPAEPVGRCGAFRLLSGDIACPLACLGWRTAGTLHPDTPALEVAALVLGAGRGSRLWREVRLPGLAAGVAASHYTPTEVGVLEMSLDAEPGELDRAVTRGFQLATELGAREPDPAELERARALLRADWARRFESMDGRATALSEFEALGDYALADTLYRQMLDVTAADVRRAAAEYLSPEAACCVVYLPPGGESVLATSWPPRRALETRSVTPRVPAFPTVRHAPLRPGPTYGNVFGVLGGGADLLVRSKRGSGLVSLGLHAPGLRSGEQLSTAGLSSLLVRCALRGAGGWGAEELAFAVEALGGSVGSLVGADVVGWSLTVPAECAGKAALLLRTIAQEAELAERDVEIERALLADDAARAADDMFRYPLQRVLRQAFGDHPYGLPVLGEADAVRRLPSEDLRSLARAFARRRPLAVAVGDLEDHALLESLAPLAEWPDQARPAAAGVAPPWRPGRGGEGREKAQTALAMAFPAPDAASPDRFAIMVMAALLGGLAGRLFQALREERSLAYTVTVVPWLKARAGAVLAYVATSPEREAEARSCLLSELERLATDRVEEIELERARRYAGGLVEVARQHAAWVAGEIVEAFVTGTLSEMAELPERLRAVTAEDLRRVAALVFQSEGRAEYVVRGGGKGG